MKRIIVITVAAFIIVVTASGCSLKRRGPEVGKWHAEVNVSDLNLSAEDRTIVSLLAGNIAYEVDVEFFEDGTYSYVMNMDKFREEIQKSTSTIVGLFFGFNIDVFIDRLVGLFLDSCGATERNNYGSYTVDENDVITAVGSDTQYFKVMGGALQQLDENGQVVLTFSKAEDAAVNATTGRR